VATLRLDLDWFRCPQGYRIAHSSEIARALNDDPASYPDDNWIVPNGYERVSYRPLDEYDMLCIGFAELKTPQSLLRFVELYGPLTRTSPEWGDSVEGLLKAARRFRELMRGKELGPDKLASVFKSQVRSSIARAYERDVQSPPPKDYDYGTLNQMLGTANIVADPKRGIQLGITTDVLIGGLWWQLAQKLSGETKIQTCRYCNAPFETGPGTGRHIDSTFCGNEHKVRYYSLARTKRKSRKR
jgi:hypothetical protein